MKKEQKKQKRKQTKPVQSVPAKSKNKNIPTELIEMLGF